MKLPSLPFIFLLLPFPARSVLAQSPETQQQAPDSPANPPATAKPIKVWTSENISSLHGAISTVGSAASDSSSVSAPNLVSSSNGATFLSPTLGQLVHPGETLHVDLSVHPGFTPAKSVGIISSIGYSNEFREGPPYSFTFIVPREEVRGSAGPLVGLQQLTLFRTVIGRKGYEWASTTVDVEEPDLPLSLFAAGGDISQYSPNHLSFYEAGGQ